jgi:hypothetical protein
MIDAYESVYERICRTPRLVPRRITQPEWYSGLVNRELLKSYYLLKASLDLLVAEAS